MSDRIFQSTFLSLLRALRPHQWVKNILVGLGAVAGHQVSFSTLPLLTVAFFAFCFCASSAYLINDICDRAHDRLHPTKKMRPFASGALNVPIGVASAGLLLVLAFGLALFLPGNFQLCLILYFLLTVCYTMLLKRYLIIDVVTLACLYGLR